MHFQEKVSGMFRHHPKILVLIPVFCYLVTLTSAGIGLRLPISIPFLSFRSAPRDHKHHVPIHQHQHHEHEHNYPGSHTQNHHYTHNDYLNHVHQDQQGRHYLHDPDSTVQFYYKEYLNGPSSRIDVHHDGCREVPKDYWHNRPKSLWAKHCVTLYTNGHCKGEGIQVAGLVAELRSVGMYYGVNSFKPCEKNIRVRFMPPVKHNHHHHQTHAHHHHPYTHENNKVQLIQLR